MSNKPSQGLYISPTRHNVLIGLKFYLDWGEPGEVGLDHDLGHMALRVVIPPRTPETTYKIYTRYGKKPRIGLSAIRVGLPMLPGTYDAITPYIFLHHSRSVPFGDFDWTPYAHAGGHLSNHARVRLKKFYLTQRAYEALGTPDRINLLIDPVEAIIRVRPDPEGAHALSPKYPSRKKAGAVSTIASIANTIPIGIYDPVSLGRFEGIFKLRRMK